jgi:hypothetical protein
MRCYTRKEEREHNTNFLNSENKDKNKWLDILIDMLSQCLSGSDSDLHGHTTIEP